MNAWFTLHPIFLSYLTFWVRTRQLMVELILIHILGPAMPFVQTLTPSHPHSPDPLNHRQE